MEIPQVQWARMWAEVLELWQNLQTEQQDYWQKLRPREKAAEAKSHAGYSSRTQGTALEVKPRCDWLQSWCLPIAGGSFWTLG